jgi:membrane fusion protein, copper/silver efflux system
MVRRIQILLPALLLAAACTPSALPLKEDASSAATAGAPQAPPPAVPDLSASRAQWSVPAAAAGAGSPTPAAAEKRPGAPAKTAIYTCGMHPEVRAAEPGQCPKCGMTLARVPVQP